MTRSTIHNLRLALLVVAILAGVAVQKHGSTDLHAECETCMVRSDRG